MFREYVNLVNESVNEGVNRGVQMFLENLNQELAYDEIFEEFGGMENSLRQIFVENGFEVTEMPTEELNEEESVEDFDAKLESILDQLTKKTDE
jgi:hypothetical protein